MRGIYEASEVMPPVPRLEARQVIHQALTSLAGVEWTLKVLSERGWEGQEEDPRTCQATLVQAHKSAAETYRYVMALGGLLAPRV